MTAAPLQLRPRSGQRVLLVCTAVLVTITWISAALFAAYIAAFYGGAAADHAPERWNELLPELYEPGRPGAAAAIGLHFAAGGVILLLGPIQLLGPVRRRAPALHRWLGRLYAACALMAGLGGLAFIAMKGTVGGLPMNLGFGLYGALMVIAAVQTVRHAVARRLDRHQLWAARLFALAIGSWLYRLEYGFWTAFTGGLGHTEGFDGWFDVVMSFFFYLPNLAAADLAVRNLGRPAAKSAWPASAAMALAAAVAAIGAWEFTVRIWAPAILARFS
ncbi:DUF2306 domain-containing protein [Caulobacter segnis]|uniref:DUF2306 domain-containing protein n=1 Tax=Caulobacter segnis TaxID=88688 RepID=UPI00240F1E6F|nr:DUF2306 domain-containing protein [Caulobacter segnis]MDG2520468.1 DUF2306 domain-containing protein [Caulobacter segnis]